MGWIARFLGVVPKDERDGIKLDDARWMLDGPATFVELLRALSGWLPPGTMLYFEDGVPDEEIRRFFAAHSVPEPVHVAIGTLWPRPKVFHVPATEAVLSELARIMDRHAEPELAIHFHVYCEGEVLLQWHDAFSCPMLVSGAVSEEQVAALARAFQTSYSSM